MPTENTRTWSAQQMAIFTWFCTGVGNLIVRARAGTGKTTTILEATARALAAIPGVRALVAAFSAQIAAELTAKAPRGVDARTLHSLGNGFLTRQVGRCQIEERKYDRNRLALARVLAGHKPATICPPEMAQLVVELVALAKGAAPLATKGADLADLQVEHDLYPTQDWVQEGWTAVRVADLAAEVLCASEQGDGVIDFDDMVWLPVRMRWVRPSFDLVVIDEAQDMNAAQLLLAQGVCKPGGRIVVVGDDRQAIYGFRGADSNSIDRLKRELAATELGLTVTYRCPKVVVALAQQLVPDYQAHESAPEGTIMSEHYDRLETLVKPGDAILSRTNAPLAIACLRLLRAGIRAVVRGRNIGTGLVRLCEKLAGKRGCDFPTFMQRLTEWQTAEVAKWTAAGKEAKATETADRAETIRALADGVSTVAELTARLKTLFQGEPTDKTGPDAGVVVLSSVHKAKGLEWDRVFLFVETFRADDIEEENIQYVAITRAKSVLINVRGVIDRRGDR